MVNKPVARVLLLLLATVSALAILRSFPMAIASNAALIALLALCAWLITWYLNPLRRLQRHALLNQAINPHSRWRQRLWESQLSRLWLMLVALSGAILALLVSVQLRPPEWWVMLASIGIFALVFPGIRRVVTRHARTDYINTLSLRLAGWLTIALTVVLLCVMQIWFLEVPDTRSLSFVQVAESAFRFAYARAEAPLTGTLLGVSAALSDLSWHAMQVASSEVSLTAPWKVAGWLVFVVFNAVKVSVLWWVLLGACAIVQSMQHLGARRAISGSLSPLGMLFSAVILSYLALMQLDVERLLSWSPRQAEPPAELRCDADSQLAAETTLEQLAGTHLRTEQGALQEIIEVKVTTRVADAFARAEAGIDDFLDWNYSLRGQYTQLFLLGAGMVDQGALTRSLEARVSTLVSQPLSDELSTLDTEVSNLLQTRVEQFYGEHKRLLNELIQTSDCLSAHRDLEAMASYLDKSWVGMGSAAGIVTAVSLRGGGRVTAQVATRALGRRLATRAAATNTARAGARATAAGSGGAAGLLCGPAAPFCAFGFGAAAWVAVDLSINAIDEALNREQMKAQLMQRLKAQQIALEQQLNLAYSGALAELLAPVHHLHQQRFQVARDGL